ncbi:MAG: phosphoenolpyruvate carboxylase [Anaerolineae bacterium]|nr:phosphoenolpyruvate carboxylase [Anaerolineae bacterium]
MTAKNTERSTALSTDIRLLGGLLGEIIREQHGEASFALVEQIRASAKARRDRSGTNQDQTNDLAAAIRELDLEAREVLIKAFGNYFQLINIAEDQQRVRVLRQREADGVLDESVDAAIRTLHEAGVTAEQIQDLFNQLRVRLVLTAHPSEAKRKEVLIKLRTIADMIARQDLQDLLPREQAGMEAQIKEEIEELWQTPATRTTRKTVADEVDFGLYFLTSTIMDVALDVYDDIERSLNAYYPETDWSQPPGLLRYASWIGGDRDGNPNVTSDVTLQTLQTQREAARQVYLQEVALLRDHLTQSVEEIGVSHALQRAIEAVGYPEEFYPGEIYRQQLDIIWNRLKRDEYHDSRELLNDLLLIDESLRQNKGAHVANGSLRRLIRKVRLFGLHLMPLDIREDARLQIATLDELFRHYGLVENYATLPEEEKQALLNREIGNPRPFFPTDTSQFSEIVQRVIATWRMIGDAHRRYSPIVIDTVIASMCQFPSDVLGMLLMATEVGVQEDVELVPLFETIDDLYHGSEIMKVLFKNETYWNYMLARGKRRGLHQQIMIGYSDSSKDGGYLASNWHLYRAQQLLTETCEAHGVSLQLFHGRGGSIGRGGGPTNRAILSQPPSSLKGGIKITEQGEVIAYRYTNATIGRRHLHQIMHAMLLALGTPQVMDTDVKPEWREAMSTLSEVSRRAYRTFVYETPGFLDYWYQATPINELARLPISSRPAKRASSGGFGSIRAIPWIFSWMQSRAIVPSWFGVGTALQHFSEHNGLDLLHEMYRAWPFFHAVIENVQLDVAKADMGIAALYASLVADEQVRSVIFGQIKAEHERTCDMLCAVLEQDELLSHSPVIKRSIERRNPYVDPLNFIQVALLAELRTLEPDTPEYDAVLRAVLSTISSIAAGMKTTG